MIEDKDVHIQVYSEYDGHSIQVLELGSTRLLHSSSWSHDHPVLGAGGEKNFVELLKFLGYNVYHEDVY